MENGVTEVRANGWSWGSSFYDRVDLSLFISGMHISGSNKVLLV